MPGLTLQAQWRFGVVVTALVARIDDIVITPCVKKRPTFGLL